MSNRKDYNSSSQNNNFSRDSYGLEPPIIYRDSSENSSNNKKNSRSNSKSNRKSSNNRSYSSNTTNRHQAANSYSYYQKNNEEGKKKNTKTKSKVEVRRRQDKKRKLKKSIRRLITAFFILLAIIVIVVVLSFTVFFKVDKISIAGSGIYSSNEIIAASGIENEDSLLLIDKEDAEERIETLLPYIYSVEINLSLPSEVKINVTEATAEYAIKNKDKTYILMDDNFKVLEENSEKKPSDAIIITTNDKASAEAGYQIKFKNEETLDNLLQLASAIKETSFTEATKIKTKGTYENYIIYDSRITFKLGECDDLESKIYKGLAACEKLNESNPGVSGTLDLTLDKQIYFSEN